jgi:hypothetical protein
MPTNKPELRQNDKLIRVSFPTWKKLRAAAFRQNTYVKTILDEIVSGKTSNLEILFE